MGKGRLLVSPQLIHQALQLPEDVQIKGAYWDFNFQALQLVLHGPQFPEVNPGSEIPLMRAEASTEMEIEEVRKIKWSFKPE